MRNIIQPFIVLILAPLLLGQAAVPTPSQANGSRAFMTGAKLVELCRTENPYCTGYVAGVADTLAPLRSFRREYCSLSYHLDRHRRSPLSLPAQRSGTRSKHSRRPKPRHSARLRHASSRQTAMVPAPLKRGQRSTSTARLAEHSRPFARHIEPGSRPSIVMPRAPRAIHSRGSRPPIRTSFFATSNATRSRAFRPTRPRSSTSCSLTRFRARSAIRTTAAMRTSPDGI